MPFANKFRKEMIFPNEGDKVGEFKVISVKITHISNYGEDKITYTYPINMLIEGKGTIQDVKQTFSPFFNKKKTIYSGYGNPYEADTGPMNIEELKNNRFKVSSQGSAVRVKKPSIDIEEKALLIYEAMFSDKSSVTIDDVSYSINLTPRAKVRRVMIDGLSFLEQNPKKSSKWAQMAREGHKIMWVLKGRSYLCQVRDGIFYDFRKK